jgi:hypothetical protein
MKMAHTSLNWKMSFWIKGTCLVWKIAVALERKLNNTEPLRITFFFSFHVEDDAKTDCYAGILPVVSSREVMTKQLVTVQEHYLLSGSFMNFLVKHKILFTMKRKQLACPFASSLVAELALIKYFCTPHPVLYWCGSRSLNKSDVFSGFRCPDSYCWLIVVKRNCHP